MNLRDFEALTFDCYGTLIDWEGGIWDALQPILAVNRRNDVTRTLALSTFARLESEQESAAPTLLYSAILSRVHALFAKALELESTKELDTDFGNSVPHWPAFGDTADALRYLKTRYKLVILSNVHREGFAASNGVVAPLWLRAKSAYGGGRGMFEHEVSQAQPVQARGCFRHQVLVK